MEKTIKLLILSMVITGTIFTGCQQDVSEVVDNANQNIEQAAQDAGEMVDDVEQAVADAVAEYADGEYTQNFTYISPGGSQNMEMTMTLEGGVVTNLIIVPGATDPGSEQKQSDFMDGVNEVVVGKDLDDIDGLSAVNGASLTSAGFSKAVEEIKTEAKK